VLGRVAQAAFALHARKGVTNFGYLSCVKMREARSASF
jgi:hypothetical protein